MTIQTGKPAHELFLDMSGWMLVLLYVFWKKTSPCLTVYVTKQVWIESVYLFTCVNAVSTLYLAISLQAVHLTGNLAGSPPNRQSGIPNFSATDGLLITHNLLWVRDVRQIILNWTAKYLPELQRQCWQWTRKS